MRKKLIIGTRGSPLALWQSNYIKGSIESAHPGVEVILTIIVTTGDKSQDSKAAIPAIGGKGLFTAELEEALRAKEIDLAVHSLKDLPTAIASEFTVAAVPVRAAPNDVFVSRSGCSFMELPRGAVVGTSSLRRVSQVLRARPDLKIELIRGNVDTRLKKVRDPNGVYDGTLLAQAGVERLGYLAQITEILPADLILPAPGQGALGIECRADDADLITGLHTIHDYKTMVETSAERSFLQALGAGCNTPVAALALLEGGIGSATDGILHFKGRCLSPDGTRCIEVQGQANPSEAGTLGQRMADVARQQGFHELRI